MSGGSGRGLSHHFWVGSEVEGNKIKHISCIFEINAVSNNVLYIYLNGVPNFGSLKPGPYFIFKYFI